MSLNMPSPSSPPLLISCSTAMMFMVPLCTESGSITGTHSMLRDRYLRAPRQQQQKHIDERQHAA